MWILGVYSALRSSLTSVGPRPLTMANFLLFERSSWVKRSLLSWSMLLGVISRLSATRRGHFVPWVVDDVHSSSNRVCNQTADSMPALLCMSSTLRQVNSERVFGGEPPSAAGAAGDATSHAHRAALQAYIFVRGALCSD